MNFSRPYEESVSHRITDGLGRLAVVLRAQAWKGATQAGLTPTQAHALTLIGATPGGTRLNALATQLGISPPTANNTVMSLIEKGYVEKRPGSDKRSITLIATPEGMEMAGHVASWSDFLISAVDTLPTGEQAQFLGGLIKVIHALQVQGDIPVQRMCVTCRHFRPHAHAGALPHHCAFVDAPLAGAGLRLDCREHEPAEAAFQAANWTRFLDAPADGAAAS